MKNKKFTPKLYTGFLNGFVVLMFLFAFMGVQSLSAQTQDCPLSCNDMVQVSLDDECLAIITPEMIIEGENDTITCGYEIYTIVDENNNVVGHSDGTGNWILDGDANPDYTYKTLMATVGFQNDHNNSCMGGLRLEDKIAPTLRCLDTVYVACSEDLSDYLNTDTDARYKYTGTDPIVPSVGPNLFGFPFTISPGNDADIPFDVNNKANQSEIITFVQALLSMNSSSNVTVEIQAPTENSPNTLNSPYKDDYFYGIQADDQYVGGLWHIIIHNNSAYDVTVTDAQLRINSVGFLRIGNGVIVNDNCHLDEAVVEVIADYTTPNDTSCASYFQERIIKYQGTDWRGMKTPVCEHVIRWEHNGFDDMEWPHNWDGIDNPPLSCNGHFMQATPGGDFTETNQIWDTNGDGYPQPEEIDVPTIDGNPIWPNAGYCMLNVIYTDEVFEICPGSFKVLRKWTAYDMCEPGADDCCNNDANPRSHYQLIKVIDNTPITFETNHVGYVEVSANPFDCSACVTLPVPIIQNYGCSEGYTYEVGYCPTGNGIFEYFDNITSHVVNGETVYTICDLPVGETCVRYTVTDLCGNKSYGTLTVRVIDDIPPIPVCDEHTVATVTTDCTARVYAETFDDGSFDNCSDVHFQVARMRGSSSIGPFGDYADFGQSDVGKTSQVVLKVIDEEGNWNTCMVEVYVDDKIPPTINCPDNVNIDCNVDPHDVDLTGGEADYWDNCGATLTHEDFGSLNQCNVGTIRRKWTVTDNGGKTATCTQYIYIENYHPFKMRPRDWPRDVTNLLGCSDADTDPSNTGEPDLSNDDYCSMVASTYSDRIFNVVDGACYKILRDWSVIDWCQYGDDPVFLGLPGHPYEGMWVHTQIIMVNDYNAPVITSDCDNQTICAYNSDCTGDVTLVAEADDECTPDDELVWSYRVTGPNLQYPIVGNTNTFNKSHMELGWYDIHWTVEDKCGNISECSYSFKVEDCKNPTPLCYSEITTVLMPTTDPRMVSIKARDFDRGSDDNCDRGSTCEECNTDLRFSFSGTDPYDSTRTFTEDDEGLHTLDMWVWDQAGNKDFCTVTVYIQDNVAGTNAMLAGQIITEDDKKVENASVKLEDMDVHETQSVKTNGDGFFEFSVPMERDYKLQAEMNDNYLNGLTTLDLVIIQKHILGIKELNTPYKLLAADANNDQKITASDILGLRKLILGTAENPGINDAWMFVNSKYEFINPQNPWLTQEGDMHTIYVNNINNDLTDNHFIAVKIGDVNNTAVVNSTSSTPINMRGVLSMNMVNKTFKSGETISVPVKISGINDLSGMQFSLNIGENLEFKAIEANELKVNANNYSIHDNKLFFSWNALKDQVINEDEILFTLVLKAKNNGQLINQLNLVTDLNPEAYNEDLDIMGLELNYRNEATGGFALYQNTPNPFSNETKISFSLPEDGNVTITVFDVTGKVILKKSGEFVKGYNSVKMSKDDLKNLSGVMYYKVENEENMAVRKMILLAK